MNPLAQAPPLRLGPNEPTKQQRGPVRWPGRQADRQVTQTDRPADRNGRRNSRFPAGAARLQGRLSRMTHRSSGCLPCDSQALRRVSWQAGEAGRLALAGRCGAGRQAGRGTSPSLCSGEINPIPPKRTERKGATPSRSRGRGRRVSRSGVGGIVKRREKLRGASVGGRAAECVIMQNRVPEDRRRSNTSAQSRRAFGATPPRRGGGQAATPLKAAHQGLALRRAPQQPPSPNGQTGSRTAAPEQAAPSTPTPVSRVHVIEVPALQNLLPCVSQNFAFGLNASSPRDYVRRRRAPPPLSSAGGVVCPALDPLPGPFVPLRVRRQ